MNGGILQLFLILNALFIGGASVVAFRHARAHFFPEKHDAEKKHDTGVKLSPAVRAELLQEARENYRKILDNAASELQLDLSKTTATLNKDLAILGNQIISDEMKRYRASLDELQRHTENAIASTRTELDSHKEELQTSMAAHQKELLSKMTEEVEAEKQRLLTQIDMKLADAAASFLIETLGHDVDLGAQSAYLTKMIEQHKDEFKKEIDDASSSAK